MVRTASKFIDWSATHRPNSRTWLLALILVAIAAVACGTGASSSETNVSSETTAQVTAGGAIESTGNAPAVTGETFEHGSFSLDQHAGKPVLVNFWFPSCPPCRAEMPDLQASNEQYGEQVAFIGLQQLGLDSAANGQAFVRELGLTYPNMPDVDSLIQVSYEVLPYPTTIFLDKNHNIARTWTGIIGEEQINEQLAALLAG